MKKQNCPCGSGKDYQECCGVYHNGKSPENAEKLMRSRYSAYAMRRADYIMKTTHPDNPRYMADRAAWEKQILQFSDQTVFRKLDVLSFEDGEKQAYVTFFAHLSQGGQDASFKEKSLFEKFNGEWLYKQGLVLEKQKLAKEFQRASQDAERNAEIKIWDGLIGDGLDETNKY